MNRKQRQRVLHDCKMLAVYVAVLLITASITKITAGEDERELIETESTEAVIESATEIECQQDVEEAMVTIFNIPVVTKEQETESTYTEEPDEFDDYEKYILAKIAMAEAEGEDLEGKALVVRVVLNRVESDYFPDTVEEVVFQKNQFSPIKDGRWDRVEPNEDCYKALEMVLEDGWDESFGALYFESKGDSTWHRDNLKYLFQHGNHYFYTEKGVVG